MAKDEECMSVCTKLPISRVVEYASVSASTSDSGESLPGVLQNYDTNTLPRKYPNGGAKHLPIPRGNSPYALAKRAEYEEKDLAKAEQYYKIAILEGERVESAIKDLASVMHQQGKTKEACTFLRKHRDQFNTDPSKFENLLVNLEKQVVPTGNCLNKLLKVSNISKKCNKKSIKKLFKNSSRILDITFHTETQDHLINHYAVLKFPSHSAARKTLEGFHSWDKHRVDWLSVTGEVIGDASFPRHSKLDDQQRLLAPLFSYSLFARDPENLSLTLPVDGYYTDPDKQQQENFNSSLEALIGSSLCKAISLDFDLRVSAKPFVPGTA
jgi:hypothetical protein